MTDEKLIEKIRKLLGRTTDRGHTVAEAATAAAAAQAIIDKYKVDLALLSEDEGDDAPIRCCNDFPLFVGDPERHMWKWDLIWALGEANGCVPWSSEEPDGNGGYHRVAYVVGATADAQTVQYLHQYLVAEIDRLARLHRGEGRDRIWFANFRLGAVEEIAARLEEKQRYDRKALKRSVRQEAKRDDNPAALARVNKALSRIEEQSTLVEKWMEENELTHGQTTDVDDEYESPAAFEAGRTAGASVSLGGNTTRALPPGK